MKRLELYAEHLRAEQRCGRARNYDTTSRRAYLYDHSHAFLSASRKQGLLAAKEQLGIGSHCLAQQVSSLDGLWEWGERIKQIPEFYIRQLLEEAVDVGLPKEDVSFCGDFLLERRTKLPELFRKNRNSFPRVSASLWDQQAEEVGDYCI
jgi:hypothetical protein